MESKIYLLKQLLLNHVEAKKHMIPPSSPFLLHFQRYLLSAPEEKCDPHLLMRLFSGDFGPFRLLEKTTPSTNAY